MPRQAIRIGKAAARTAIAAVLLLAAAWAVAEIYIAALPGPDLSRAGRLSTAMLAEDGRVLKLYLADDDRWRLRTTPGDVPKHYLSFLLAYEDRRFLEHRGIDTVAVLRAAYLLLRHGRVVSGASTITMQTARLLEGQKPGLLGKLRQAALAIKLERALDKQSILSLYLTLVPFGGNIEGVRAASLHYFGIEPVRLSIAQSALLVAIPQAPERRRPSPASAAARDARDWVLQRMAARNILSADEVAEAAREPIPTRRGASAFLAHQLGDRLRGERKGDEVLQTLIGHLLQARIEAIVGEFASRQADRVGMAALVVRRKDMAVRAYIGGANYFHAERGGMIDLVRAVRSPGSALKPIIYGLAFEDLVVHPNTIVSDDYISVGGYAPENFDKKYRGELLAREALIQSLNTVAVVLLNQIGPERFVARLRAAGAFVDLPDPHKPPGLATALGGLGIDLENLALLFAGIANGGRTHALRYLAAAPLDAGKFLMSPEAAWAVTDVLADMPPARGRAALRSADGGRRVAYKTGTSYGFKDAWAAGFDAEHVVAVWVGRADGIGRAGETGATSAVPLMHQIFELLPNPEHDVAAARPAHSILAKTSDLPDRLKRFTSPTGSAGSQTASKKFEIRFPARGSTIRVSRDQGALAPLTLWATGGRPPFRWYVDGRALTTAAADNRITWTPQGRGQVEITIIDADGARAASSAWLE